MSSQTNNLVRLLDIMRTLRGPEGCPWDREQDHHSIRHNLIEEAYEAVEALDRLTSSNGNPAADRHQQARNAFCDELGDVLLQVVFHAQISEEAGSFRFDDIAGSIADKLVRRHPHVFGNATAEDSATVLQQWEHIKRGETASQNSADSIPSIFSEVVPSLPALLKADKVQRKAARVGFDWPETAGVLDKVEEEVGELKQALASGNDRAVAEEIGDLLFAVVNLARHADLHAEELLNQSTTKFVQRFQRLEKAVHETGRQVGDCSLDELDAFWEDAKLDPDIPVA